MNKIKVKSIRFPFSECPSINTKKEFNSWDAAESHLFQCGEWNQLGYYKTDFLILFEDGHKYQGRYDIGSDEPTLRAHVVRVCEMMADRKWPAHLSQDQINHYRKYTNPKVYVDLLDNYDIDLTN